MTDAKIHEMRLDVNVFCANVVCYSCGNVHDSTVYTRFAANANTNDVGLCPDCKSALCHGDFFQEHQDEDVFPSEVMIPV